MRASDGQRWLIYSHSAWQLDSLTVERAEQGTLPRQVYPYVDGKCVGTHVLHARELLTGVVLHVITTAQRKAIVLRGTRCRPR